MSKVKTLAILGAGYVLGAQAGRKRFEQIKSQAVRISEHPRTQQLAHQARETVAAKLPPSVTSRFPGASRSEGAGTPSAEPTHNGVAEIDPMPLTTPPSHL